MKNKSEMKLVVLGANTNNLDNLGETSTKVAVPKYVQFKQTENLPSGWIAKAKICTLLLFFAVTKTLFCWAQIYLFSGSKTPPGMV